MEALSLEMLCSVMLKIVSTVLLITKPTLLRATTVLLRTTSDQGQTVELHSLTTMQFLS